MLKFMSITILIALFIFSCSRLGDRYMGVNFVISNCEVFQFLNLEILDKSLNSRIGLIKQNDYKKIFDSI